MPSANGIVTTVSNCTYFMPYYFVCQGREYVKFEIYFCTMSCGMLINELRIANMNSVGGQFNVYRCARLRLVISASKG